MPKKRGLLDPLKYKILILRGPFQFKGSNSRVILPMRSAGVVPCKQALCHDLVDVMLVVVKHSFQ